MGMSIQIDDYATIVALLYIHVYVYVCIMCIFICVCLRSKLLHYDQPVYTYEYVCTYLHSYMFTCTRVPYIHMCIYISCTYSHEIYTYTYTCTHTYTCTYASMYTRVSYKYVLHMSMYTYTHMRTITRPDYYATIGVRRGAEPSEIKKAFRELSKVYHPDKTAGNTELQVCVFVCGVVVWKGGGSRVCL